MAIDTFYPGMITHWPAYTEANKLPKNWMPCDGRKLEIKQYPQLFKAIGTTYGGDGTNNFALPNLSGRILIGAGQGNGLDEVKLGAFGGADKVTLTIDQLPAHSHKIQVATGGSATSSSPKSNYLGASRGGDKDYINNPPTFDCLASNAISPVGKAEPDPISVEQPGLTMYFIICVNT